MRFTSRLLTFAILAGFGSLGRAQEPSADEQARRDQLRIDVQAICPVSGQKLGEHGPPIKTKVGEESVFLCCQACLNGKVDDAKLAEIHANIAKAQGVCPVMQKELPESPKSVIVDGQRVFLCCPPCGKKVSKHPEKYLPGVFEHYANTLEQIPNGNRR